MGTRVIFRAKKRSHYSDTMNPEYPAGRIKPVNMDKPVTGSGMQLSAWHGGRWARFVVSFLAPLAGREIKGQRKFARARFRELETNKNLPVAGWKEAE